MSQSQDNPAYYERTLQLMNWRRYPEAIAEAEKWIAGEPENAMAYAMLGQIHMKAGNNNKAMHWAGEALRYDPENTIAWFVRTVVLYATGKEELFLESAREARRLDPLESNYSYLTFNLYHKKGKTEEAREALNHALYLQPDRGLYLAADSYLRANMKDFKGSLASEASALYHDPENDQTFMYLAWAAEKRGDYKKEIEFLKNAVRLNPEDAQIRQEYLNSLQKKFWFYRILLVPAILRRLKLSQLLMIWVVAWLLFRPLIVLLIIVYILSHWISKLLVRVQVFGWSSLFRKIKM
ncbi:tetratricopeptide repeat protein [Paenibacillus sp. sgz500958]|uniref:tetratricopeptide repeat protein n=1 Tax=Paenibacillus sp. sgz500958 TaxID=3242475 RepID=UPI0036D34B78